MNHRVVSVAERSEIRALDLQSVGPGLNSPHPPPPPPTLPPLVEFDHGIREVKFSTMLVNRQLVCLHQLEFLTPLYSV